MGHGAAMRRTRVGETSGPAMALPCLARTPKPSFCPSSPVSPRPGLLIAAIRELSGSAFYRCGMGYW